MTDNALVGYTLYDHPADFPDHWVLRRWRMLMWPSGVSTIRPETACLCDTLQAALDSVPDGLVCMRDAGDPPMIVATWL